MLTLAGRELVERAAERAGVSLSTFTREAVVAAARRAKR
jgi:hypothetical protein